MGFYDDIVVPYCLELTCGMAMLAPHRKQAAKGLHGTVLEIGFGSGLNLPHLPPAVTRVLGVDPSLRSRHIGRKRIAAAPCPIDFIGLDAEVIEAESASADSALSTFTLCTIPEPERALREVRRILKPGGTLSFLEHGRAPDAGVARWQDRLNGMQRALCGGCNVNRDIAAIVRAAGFEIEALHTEYLPGPPTHGYVYSGVARALPA